MTTKINQALLGGILGTAAMTLFNMIAAMIGMPKLSPPLILSAMMSLPIIVGWLMHFMIGIIFALLYAYFFFRVVRKISNIFLKGAILGIAAFIFGQIALALMDTFMGGMPPMEGSMVMIMILSVVGHILFGIAVVTVVKDQSVEKLSS